MKRDLHDAVIGVKLISAEMKSANSDFDENIKCLNSKIDSISSRISEIESYIKISTSIYSFFSNNWWKIFPFFLTIFAGLAELMVFLRNLPPSN